MESQVLLTALSAIIAGIFHLIGKRMEFARADGGTVGNVTPDKWRPPVVPSLPGRAAQGGIDYGLVVRQVGILQLVINLIGFFVGLAMGAAGGADEGQFFLTILFVGTLLLVGGFVWAALKVERATMWRHLAAVAVGVAVVTVILNIIGLNLIGMQIPVTPEVFFFALIFALAHTFVSMGIGGAIAKRLRP